MICKIYSVRDTGTVLAGTITLSGDQILTHPNKGFENTLESIKDYSAMYNGRRVKLQDDPKLWFSLLPQTVRGTYGYAQLVEGEPVEKSNMGKAHFTVYDEDGEEVGQIDGEDIATEDVRLDNMFYDLVDEGVPVEIKRGTVRYEEATPENLAAYLKREGYEIKEREQMETENDMPG